MYWLSVKSFSSHISNKFLNIIHVYFINYSFDISKTDEEE